MQPSARHPSGMLTPSDVGTAVAHISGPATLKHVIGPALAAVAGPTDGSAQPAQAAAVDAVDALARLEAAAPGSCLALVAQVMTDAVAAPIAGGGDLVQLRTFAARMAAAVQAGARSHAAHA